jgi:hypothetical protein
MLINFPKFYVNHSSQVYVVLGINFNGVSCVMVSIQ